MTQRRETDPVNHPKHYEYGGFQVIDIIEAVLPKEWSKGFLLGNVIKYVLRSFRKNGYEDLHKAKWYLDRLCNQLDKEDIDTGANVLDEWMVETTTNTEEDVA